MAAASRVRARLRPRSLWHLVRAAVVLAALGTVSAWALTVPPERPAERRAQSTDLRLSTDDEGAALFELRDLAPGSVESRCVTLAYRGSAPALVRLAATAGGSGLAEHLQTTIEVGRGGRFGDCRGFTGQPVYVGTLAGLARLDQAGVTAFATEGDTERTFRMTVSLDDAPGGASRTADARFTWHAQALATPAPPVDPPAPPPEPGGEPVDAPDATPGSGDAPAEDVYFPSNDGSSPADGAAGQAPAAAPPAPAPAGAGSPAAVPPAPGRSGGRATGGDRRRPSQGRPPRRDRSGPPTGAGDRGGTVPRRGGSDRRAGTSGHSASRSGAAGLLDAVGRLVKPVIERSGFPLLLLLLVGLFLLVQDQIDRRDPKLALAPLRDEPDLAFPAGGDS